ncbi:PEP-CTERM sorting domain-containing protein [Methylophilus sp. Leaf408]|uniref:PEP-CTERM sorting domain-containing protein n=1 Tax=Methylophilus sp. Leaf408 TaxID=2876561 RepID=UPI001E308B8B|nr:PEP-CTERM sorting domain-containing protein [Methylophilus sp. Leaf408]
MKTTIWKQSLAVVAISFAANSAYAGNFVSILNNGDRTPGSTNSTTTDPFFISTLPISWTQLATATSDVFSPVNGNVVGSFIDTVWFESSSNSYIIGSYFKMLNNTNGITEINSIVRSGFSEIGETGTISAAWTSGFTAYGSGTTGYRLRDPSRSDYKATYVAGASTNFDADKVAIRTDVALNENNPNSGLYLLKVDATGLTYEWTANAVHIVQGASAQEGARIRQDMFLGGFALTAVTAVPEAETYAMMMAGLALIGTIVRRRKSA